MPHPLAILAAMPSPVEFYGTYWNRQPFVVRKAIPATIMDSLIGVDELAGLAMEDGPPARLVRTAGKYQDWTCDFGPFAEDILTALPESDWSLLVQNVEQYDPNTSALLPYFNFAPRWMIDDIMVGLSVPGGSVGPHMDSYHVFLVQGQGIRKWKISDDKIADDRYLENPDLKILDRDFTGVEIETTCGDVLYVPPRFGHQGITVATALTFSVGFLGPKLSQLFASYGYFLAQNETRDHRYVGDGLGPESAGQEIDPLSVGELRSLLSKHVEAEEFTAWLVGFFADTGLSEFDDDPPDGTPISTTAFHEQLKNGGRLVKPEYVKFVCSQAASGGVHLGFCGQNRYVDEEFVSILKQLMAGSALDLQSDPIHCENPLLIGFLYDLLIHQALEFEDS